MENAYRVKFVRKKLRDSRDSNTRIVKIDLVATEIKNSVEHGTRFWLHRRDMKQDDTSSL